jgi:hypothetical protein
MTRQTPLFVLTVSLLTGCAQLSRHAHSDNEFSPRNQARLTSKDQYSTAAGTEQPDHVTKMPVNPERDQRVKPMNIEPISPPNVRDRQEPKKAAAYVLTADQKPKTMEEVNAQLPIPLPTSAQEQTPDLEPAVQAFHYIFVGKHQDAIKTLRAYDEPTQEFLLRVLPLLTHIAKTSIDRMSSNELDILNEQVKGVASLMRTRCRLSISKMAFCKSINGFANFEPLPDDHAFLARTDKRPGDLVQLYVELNNFASKETKEGDYLTKLACSLELKDTHGEKVWSHTFDKKDTTYRRSACVNDYHGNFSFYVPALPAGTYQLTMLVVDETIPEHRRVDRKSQVFRVTPVANSTSR